MRAVWIALLCAQVAVAGLLWWSGERYVRAAGRLEEGVGTANAALAGLANELPPPTQAEGGARTSPPSREVSERRVLQGPFDVIDGDTFKDAAGVRYRLADVDAPDPSRPYANCAAEAALAPRATEFLDDQLKAGEVVAEIVGLQPARRGFRERWVARVLVDGEDVAAKLVDAGLGRWTDGQSFAWCAGF